MMLSKKIQVLAMLTFASVAFVGAADTPSRLRSNRRGRQLKDSKSLSPRSAQALVGRAEQEQKKLAAERDTRTRISDEVTEEMTSRVFIGRPTIFAESAPATTPTFLNTTNSSVPLAYTNTQYNQDFSFSRPASTSTQTSSDGTISSIPRPGPAPTETSFSSNPEPYQSSGVNLPVGRPGSLLPPDTDSPTEQPSSSPSKYPTPLPTLPPTPEPTTPPTPLPTVPPTFQPTAPSDPPTPVPTTPPTPAPTADPTKAPTPVPTLKPTPIPTTFLEGVQRPGVGGFNQFTDPPSIAPIPEPTKPPTASPTALPTAPPTVAVSFEPTFLNMSTSDFWNVTDSNSTVPTGQGEGRTDINRGNSLFEDEPAPAPAGSGYSPFNGTSSFNGTSTSSVGVYRPGTSTSGAGSSIWSPTPPPTFRQTSPPAPGGGVNLNVGRPGGFALTASPTLQPSTVPSAIPSSDPTAFPTPNPTAPPTFLPTPPPTVKPTVGPTAPPTPLPTPPPTFVPTYLPTPLPTPAPTHSPTTLFGSVGRPGLTSGFGGLNNDEPSSLPSDFPSMEPSLLPTVYDP